MKEPKITRIVVDEKVANQELVARYQKNNPDATVTRIELTEEYKVSMFRQEPTPAKREILLTEKQGHTVKQCPGTDRTYRCCNYHVINQTSNCPIDCTYCILQFYLNNPVTTVYANSEKLLTEVKEKIATQPRRFFRIGTGELSDSLAFDSSSDFSRDIVTYFADLDNVLLELKTKSNRIENLLDLDHKGHTVVSWSVNPQVIIDAEEHKAASLQERLEAMAKVQAAGYKIGFHFDPLLFHEGWEQSYPDLIKQLFQVVDPTNVTWVSIGSLRFPPEMKDKVLEKFPKSKIMFAELIRGMDGKMRYPKPLRLDMYRTVYKALQTYGGEDLFIYFCMESAEIWERVMGWSPEDNEHLDYLFAESLHRRFPGLMQEAPDRQVYDDGIPLHQDKADIPGF
ncbi:MAG: DNA photolyase [Candidatus Marinimicrobia bacterium]|nr:DNA photolyase [Candidatus Neomarinimicrobiota bacterium]MCF7850285.1 DNA photolyase [Candidatus Neomarinimicrobiota bacterium]MCF7903818.1 DNA photolyase [Candidatus Neomarinimicrobiota bacterium]